MSYQCSFGETPDELIKMACNEQCPDGYSMEFRSQQEWEVIANAVNKGIDSHLEAVTSRSTFDATTGKCLVHPDELHVLLRRLFDDGGDESWLLRGDILTTLDIWEV